MPQFVRGPARPAAIFVCRVAAPFRIHAGSFSPNKKGSRERDPYALSPSIRFRRGGTGPPREEETAASYVARSMPQPKSTSPSNLALKPQDLRRISASGAPSDIRPLRFLTKYACPIYSLWKILLRFCLVAEREDNRDGRVHFDGLAIDLHGRVAPLAHRADRRLVQHARPLLHLDLLHGPVCSNYRVKNDRALHVVRFRSAWVGRRHLVSDLGCCDVSANFDSKTG